MTGNQIKKIHIAAKSVGLSDEQYRTVLRTLGGVESSKLLSQADYEQCMALFEEMGFRQILSGVPQGDFYWRDRASGGATRRLRYKAELLHNQVIASGVPYRFSGLISRASEARTDNLEQLTMRELWNLIECLKAILARRTSGTRPPGLTD